MFQKQQFQSGKQNYVEHLIEFLKRPILERQHSGHEEPPYSWISVHKIITNKCFNLTGFDIQQMIIKYQVSPQKSF